MKIHYGSDPLTQRALRGGFPGHHPPARGKHASRRGPTLEQDDESLVQLACLAWFTNTEYFAWKRSRPQAAAAGLGGLILVAVLVGALAGVIGAPEEAPVRLQINL